MTEVNDTKKCPYCAETIQAAAIVCRYCGRDLAEPVAKPVPQKKGGSGCWVWGIIIIVVLVGLFFIRLAGRGGDDTSSSDHSPTMAKIMCEQFMKDYLKAPSTAKFQSTNQQTATSTSSAKFAYRVNAYVDAENSFGAMVRTNYICEIEYDINTDKWKLLDLVTD